MTSSRPRAVVALAMVAIGLLIGPPASAHGGETELEVVSRTPSGTMTVTYEISLAFEDGHPVEGAAVAAVAESGPTAIGPIDMAPAAEAGHYTVQIAFPTAGTWSVRFTSVEPEVTSTVEEVVAAPDTTITAETSTTAAEPTPTAGDTTTTVAGTDAGTAEGDDSDGRGSGMLIALGAVAVVVLAGTFLITRRGKRSDA